MPNQINGPISDAVGQIANSPKGTYFGAAITTFFSGMTYEDIGGLVSPIIMVLTFCVTVFLAISTHRRNQAQTRAANATEARAKANAFPHEIDDRL